MKPWNASGITAFDSRENYAGEDLSHMLQLGVMRHRDADCLSESNFAVALERLGGESETVQVHRFGHWAFGWYELILIDPSDARAVAEGEAIERAIADYPLLDEEDFSRREWDKACHTWKSLGISYRVEACQHAGISVFAARRAELPEDPDGALFEYLVRD